MNVNTNKPQRSGSIAVLTAVMLVALLGVCGLCINLTQVATSKSEARMAADAAAKAGAVVLGQTQDIAEARRIAKRIAARHTVSNERMRISNVDVEFGYSSINNNGSYGFVENQEPLNAIRVRCRMAEGARTGEADYFIAGPFDTKNFSLDYTAVATRVDHDLCLVIDRSGSMSWDTSNNEWQFPAEDDNDGSLIQRYFEPPHPTLSRWAALQRSTDTFFDHVEDLPIEVQVGLVTFSSNFVFGLYSSQASTIESELTNDYSSLAGALAQVGSKELIGNTNIASGMQAAVRVLTGDNHRITAKGTMVVLTDGIWNQGTNPIEVARAAADANITVHTITFSDQADQATMQAVAGIGGGNHYHAPDESSLRSIFEQIAATLPTVLTQ